MRFVALLALAFALVCGLARAGSPPPSTAMKGWELYSWFDTSCATTPQTHSAPGDDAWCFALQTGTNRDKSRDEVVKAPVTLKELVHKLAALPKGDQIFWVADPSTHFDLPPAPLRTRVEAEAKRLGLKLAVTRRQ